jgi:aminoglycoside 3-N-acetyltransferase
MKGRLTLTEQKVIDNTSAPITITRLVDDLQQLGLEAGQTVLVHSSLSKLGWVCGGTQAVIMALMDVLGNDGTLMMPTHTAQNTDPSNWGAPPVPESWVQTIRDNRPAYDPTLTPPREMGAIPESFRKMSGVKRSNHPIGSFAAMGKQADFLLDKHDSLEQMFGDTSPIGKLYDCGGHVLLLGVTHSNNTSLHLAEHRADFPSKRMVKEGVAMMVEGQRQWVDFEMMALETDDFEEIGTAYHTQHGYPQGKVGLANALFMRQAPIVDFATQWMTQNRT